MTRQVGLLVNGTAIPIDYFVQSFIDHVVGGMLEALEGTGTIETVNLGIKRDAAQIKLNGSVVPINPFVGKIVRSTTLGMVSSLKKVGEVDTLDITIKR